VNVTTQLLSRHSPSIMNCIGRVWVSIVWNGIQYFIISLKLC